MSNLKRENITDEEIEDAILRKFFRMHAGRTRHIYESDIPKGMPPNLHKRIMSSVKELRRKGLVWEIPHGKEHAFLLNLERLEEIKIRLKRRYNI